jgi:outer membrane protein W
MKRGLMVLSLLVLVGGVATASVQKGDTELNALGGFLSENGINGADDVQIGFLSGDFGYFLTDNIRVGVAAAYVNIENSIDTDIWAVGGSAKYHFMPTNQWVPYIGGQVFWARAEEGFGGNVDGILWGPVAGLRFEMNATNDFFVEYQYQIWSGDIDEVINNGNAIFVGIAHQFK